MHRHTVLPMPEVVQLVQLPCPFLHSNFPLPLPMHIPFIVQELLGGLWGSGSFKKGEVEAAVQDMLSGGPSAAAHSHSQGEGEAEGCPTCGAAASAVDAEPAAKVYLSLRRLVEEYQLSCITVRCFDVVSDSSTLCMMAFALHALLRCTPEVCLLAPLLPAFSPFCR